MVIDIISQKMVFMKHTDNYLWCDKWLLRVIKCILQLNTKIFVFLWNMPITFRHQSFCMQDRHFATLQRMLFIYLIKKYISLSDICLTMHH